MKIYIAAQKETLYDVASAFGVPYHILQAANKNVHDTYGLDEGTQVKIPSIIKPEAKITKNEETGNICAYVPDEPVHFHQVAHHWPSQDYD